MHLPCGPPVVVQCASYFVERTEHFLANTISTTGAHLHSSIDIEFIERKKINRICSIGKIYQNIQKDLTIGRICQKLQKDLTNGRIYQTIQKGFDKVVLNTPGENQQGCKNN